MKRMIALLLSLALAVSLLAACSAEQAPPETTAAATDTTAATDSGAQLVTNVDELLSAIASDTEILLAEGTYNLCDAANYGAESGSAYYSWESVYDGFQLQLHGVKNLTIRGSGIKTTTLETDPRYANVLALQNCADIMLEDLTAGHTKEQGECSGGVLALLGCTNIAMNRLGLYGCGVNGLLADNCTDISITDSDIYDCSSSGIVVTDSHSVTAENCRLYNLGNTEYGGYSVISVTNGGSVKISNCQIKDCNTMNLLVCASSTDLELNHNQFSGNRVQDAAFSLYSSDLILDGSEFNNNSIRNWYGTGSANAVDGSGKEITEEELTGQYSDSTEQEPAGERTEVHVSTVDELLAAIAPDTEIVLDAELYDLSTATGYGEATAEYYHWEEIFDGPALVISEVDNLAIRSNDGSVTGHTIAAIPRYANVLTFSKCSNITLSGFTAGHTKEPGSCAGGVLMFRDSDNILVDNCGLFGCGILGVQAEYSGNIQVTNCDIYECSQGGIQMRNTNDVVIADCTFRDLGGDSLVFIECKNVSVDGKDFESN